MLLFRIIFSLLAVPVLFAASSAGLAQDASPTEAEYTFFSVSVGWTTRIGKAIDVVFDVTTPPPGGLMGEAAIADIGKLCATTAAERLADYLRENEFEMPKYYSITVRTGGKIGMYSRLYFRTNGNCDPVRLSQLN